MLRDDLKFTLRGLRRDPLYAAAVAGTLALTLGATTAVFSIVNGVLLGPLPFPSPDRLVSIREVVPRWADRYPTLPANLRHFDLWRERSITFDAIAALDWRTTSVAGAGEPFQATIARVSGTLFDVLRTPMTMGRALARADERADQPRVTVISHHLWRDRFGSDPSVVGRPIRLGGTDYTVVGVSPPGFGVPSIESSAPSRLRSDFAAIVPFRVNLDAIGWVGSFNYTVLARVKNDVSLEQVRSEMDVLQQSVAAFWNQQAGEVIELRAQVLPLRDAITRQARSGLLLLLGAVAGVLLLACANLANLSLSRALGRVRETAVRSALGASRASLVRLVVLEQMVLAMAGGAIGILLVWQVLPVFIAIGPIDLPRLNEVRIDGRVLAFTAVTAVVAGLAVALLPALRIGRGTVQPVLRGSGGHGSTDRGGARVRATLLGLQVALSVALLVVTGLFTTSFVRLLSVDPGFSTDGVVTVEIAPVAARYPDVPARTALYDRIVERARVIPGIHTIAWTSALPLTGETWVDGIAAAGAPPRGSDLPQANYRFVGPDYFRVLSIPLLAGRSFDDRDRTRGVTPAVISARAARVLWPGEEPVGRLFTRGDPSVRFEVIGVIADGRVTALETDSPSMVYVPYWYNTEGKSLLVARTSGDPSKAMRALRAAIREIDPEIPIGETRQLQHVVDAALAGRQHQTSIFVAFGTVALTIATLGVYATTSYSVSRRRREMNIRVALGAQTRTVFALVLRQTSLPLSIGVAAGCAASLALGTAVARFLFGVAPREPTVLFGSAFVVAAAGLAAALVAARRGLQIDPVAALRGD